MARLKTRRFGTVAANVSALALTLVTGLALAAEPATGPTTGVGPGPGPNPVSGRIVFSRPMHFNEWQEPESASLFVLNRGVPRRLTDGGAKTIDDSASWSPDGSQVVYVRTDADGAYVRRVDRSGANDKIIGQGSDPVWSPKKKGQIAYVEGTDARNCLTVVNPDGTGKRQLSCLQADGVPDLPHRYWARYMEPQWSYDGRYIYISRHRWTTGGGEASHEYDIVRVDADSGQVSDLTAKQKYGFYNAPKPARDGMWMTYCDCLLPEPDYYENRIGRFDLIAGTMVPLAQGRFPVLSRDEESIAFSTPAGSLATISVSGGVPRVHGGDLLASDIPVAWYPGDRAVLVNRSRYVPVPGAMYDRLAWQLVRIDINTGHEQALGPGYVHRGGMY